MYKVIFLDDEAITLQLLESALDWQKYSIVLGGKATDGVEGIELFQQVEPDIVITDIRMPNMDGIAFTRAIRQTKKKVKVLLLSAYAEFEYAQSAIAYQISDYLLKPLDEDKLEAAIARIVQELAQENALTNTMENYRVEQAERRLLEFLTLPPESPTPTTPVDIQETFRGVDTVFRVALTTNPADLKIPGDIGGLRRFFKDQFGPGTAVLPIRPTELVMLTTRAVLQSHLDEALATLREKDQAVLFGISFIDSTFDLYLACRQAEMALHNCFYSGTEASTYSDKITFSNEVTFNFADFEKTIAEIVEQGKGGELYEKLLHQLENLFERRTDPPLIFDFVFEVLNWAKIELVKRYGATAFAEIEMVNRERVWSCATKETLCLYLDNYIDALSEVVTKLLAGDPDLYIVKRARNYTRQHYTNVEFTLQGVAEYVGLSKTHFSSVFHKTTGQKFWDYVTQLRIEKAKEMLKQSNCSNYEISRAIGYESEFHFSKTFKKVVGVAAQQYRRK
jgi:YesN/AraC family two-component response regulator